CTATLLGSFTDQLNVPWSQTACYTAVYKLHARGTTTSPTLVSPIVHVASGTQYKHTDPGSLAALSPITPVSSQVRLVKTSSADTVLTNTTVTYTVHVTNAAANAGCPVTEPNCKDVTLDD